MSEIYISCDVETDGPIPGPHSMLSLGAAAFVEEKDQPVDLFSRNFKTLPGSFGDPDTMKWWGTQPEAWAACRKDLVNPETAMSEFHMWLSELEIKHKLKPVFVGYPAGFDFLFVYWYLMYFCKHSPFSFSGMDIKTYGSALLKLPYRQSTKKNYPKRWFEGQPKHNHVALTDAIGQGMLFMKMLKENLNAK